MSKVLFVSNTANFSKFNRPFMRWFRAQGWQVDYASAGEEPVLDCDNQYRIGIVRSPFSLQNIRAYKELKALLLQNDYDIIHCHTPMGGCLARIAARKSRTKVIYTAHGFHFYKGAPLLNWLIYYPIEKWLAKYTDCLITINQEDFNFARKQLKAYSVFHINGVGVDTAKFYPITAAEKEQLRKRFGYETTDFILLYIAEFIPRKNHKFLLEQIPALRQAIPNLKVIFAGKGGLLNKCKGLAESKDALDIVNFLGYRKDIDKLCQIADVYISPSRQEGLSVSILEAMASGLPLVCSEIRGHIDAYR